jgi:hypothetical protein
MTEPSPVEQQADHAPCVHDPVHRAAHAFERDGENLCVYTWMDSGMHFPEHFHPSLEEHITAIALTCAASCGQPRSQTAFATRL